MINSTSRLVATLSVCMCVYMCVVHVCVGRLCMNVHACVGVNMCINVQVYYEYGKCGCACTYVCVCGCACVSRVVCAHDNVTKSKYAIANLWA